MLAAINNTEMIITGICKRMILSEIIVPKLISPVINDNIKKCHPFCMRSFMSKAAPKGIVNINNKRRTYNISNRFELINDNIEETILNKT